MSPCLIYPNSLWAAEPAEMADKDMLNFMQMGVAAKRAISYCPKNMSFFLEGCISC